MEASFVRWGLIANEKVYLCAIDPLAKLGFAIRKRAIHTIKTKIPTDIVSQFGFGELIKNLEESGCSVARFLF
jgi:hypothetical protein